MPWNCRQSGFGWATAVLATLLVIGSPAPAQAHPHVWMKVTPTLIFKNGTVIAIRERWVFDRWFSGAALDELDPEATGTISPVSLQDLAKSSMEGLTEFGYFTEVTLAGQPLKLSTAQNYAFSVEATDHPPGPKEPPLGAPLIETTPGTKPKVLVLDFTLPLEIPVLAEAEDFQVNFGDISFFYWMELDPRAPIAMEGQPDGCKAQIATQVDPNVVALNQSFDGQLGSGQPVSVQSINTIELKCPR